VTPLPFGGEPLWSEAAAQTLEAARACAAAVPTQLSTVPLLIGLLSVEAGLTRGILAAHLGPIDAVRQRLTAALPRQQPTPAPSQNYVTIRRLAQTVARAEGSPFVLEYHLLVALLDTPTTRLDQALRWLGTSRAAVRAALEQARAGAAGPESTYSVFSEFPSSP
jgi:ATP-dependent Clp protease ATP-binding subunit ClpA